MKNKIEDMISAYIENDISQEEKNIIEDYMDKNPEFLCKVNSIKDMMLSLKKTPTLEPSNNFLTNLEERIAKETKSIFDFSYKFKIGIAFASSLCILLVIILNNYSIKEDIAITKNIQTDSFAKAEEIDTLQNNHFSIKQVKGNK